MRMRTQAPPQVGGAIDLHCTKVATAMFVSLTVRGIHYVMSPVDTES